MNLNNILPILLPQPLREILSKPVFMTGGHRQLPGPSHGGLGTPQFAVSLGEMGRALIHMGQHLIGMVENMASGSG